MSGEHGDGLARSVYNLKLFGPKLYSAMREVKAAFDPENVMNPGKIVDAPPPDENLRFGPDYATIELDTVFDWQADGGYAGAIEMCNGAGVCRKLDIGTMCPASWALGTSVSPPAPRANACASVLPGVLPLDQLFGRELYERPCNPLPGLQGVQDECPSSGTWRGSSPSILYNYFHANGTPLFNRMMGWLPVNRRMDV